MSPVLGEPTVDVVSRWSLELRGPRLIAGSDALELLPDELRALEARRVLLVSDSGLVEAGWVDRVARLIRGHGMSVDVFDQVTTNPGDPEIQAGAEFARGVDPNVIVALGGGSCLDSAKGIALVLAGGGRVRDYRGHGRARGQLLPLVAVPTTAGTGSDGQSYAVLTDEESGAKFACGDPQLMFHTVFLDPATTSSAPPATTAAATLDALSHAIESHVSKRANPISRVISREAFSMINAGAEAAIGGNADTPTRASLQLGAFLAGRAIELAMLGAAHACANPLTRVYDTVHGVAVAVMLPHVIRLNAAKATDAYRELESRGANALAERIEHLTDLAGFARRLRDHGVGEGDLGELAADAAGQWTGTFNPVPLTLASFEHLYRVAW